eukprot:scaffold120832_cov23-Tisochrysis_lutea.AAC.1
MASPNNDSATDSAPTHTPPPSGADRAPFGAVLNPTVGEMKIRFDSLKSLRAHLFKSFKERMAALQDDESCYKCASQLAQTALTLQGLCREAELAIESHIDLYNHYESMERSKMRRRVWVGNATDDEIRKQMENKLKSSMLHIEPEMGALAAGFCTDAAQVLLLSLDGAWDWLQEYAPAPSATCPNDGVSTRPANDGLLTAEPERANRPDGSAQAKGGLRGSVGEQGTDARVFRDEVSDAPSDSKTADANDADAPAMTSHGDVALAGGTGWEDAVRTLDEQEGGARPARAVSEPMTPPASDSEEATPGADNLSPDAQPRGDAPLGECTGHVDAVMTRDERERAAQPAGAADEPMAPPASNSEARGDGTEATPGTGDLSHHAPACGAAALDEPTGQEDAGGTREERAWIVSEADAPMDSPPPDNGAPADETEANSDSDEGCDSDSEDATEAASGAGDPNPKAVQAWDRVGFLAKCLEDPAWRRTIRVAAFVQDVPADHLIQLNDPSVVYPWNHAGSREFIRAAVRVRDWLTAGEHVVTVCEEGKNRSRLLANVGHTAAIDHYKRCGTLQSSRFVNDGAPLAPADYSLREVYALQEAVHRAP